MQMYNDLSSSVNMNIFLTQCLRYAYHPILTAIKSRLILNSNQVKHKLKNLMIYVFALPSREKWRLQEVNMNLKIKIWPKTWNLYTRCVTGDIFLGLLILLILYFASIVYVLVFILLKDWLIED